MGRLPGNASYTKEKQVLKLGGVHQCEDARLAD
jgi:hypothetical protein